MATGVQQNKLSVQHNFYDKLTYRPNTLLVSDSDIQLQGISDEANPTGVLPIAGEWKIETATVANKAEWYPGREQP